MASAHARLGETLEKCVLGYGQPPAHTEGGEDYAAVEFLIFVKAPFDQIRIAFRNNHAAYIEYQQFGGMLFETIQTILDAHHPVAGEWDFTGKDLAENAGRAVGTCSWESKTGFLGSYRCLGGEACLILKEPGFDDYARRLASEDRKNTDQQIRNNEKAKLKGF